jgi:hypothetical protein
VPIFFGLNPHRRASGPFVWAVKLDRKIEYRKLRYFVSRHLLCETPMSKRLKTWSTNLGLPELLLFLTIVSVIITIFVFDHELIKFDRQTHHLLLYATSMACLLSGIYGMAKPKLDYNAAFEEPPPGPRYRTEYEKRREIAKRHSEKNKWKSEIASGLCLVLLALIVAIRGD